jgi:hypothetical protein
MHLPCKTKIEKAWLVTSLLILFLHRMLEASSAPDYYPLAMMVRVWLELAMIALSFPLGGLLMFAVQNAVFWCDECRNLDWLLDWSTLLFAGYIQWFWVLPEILRGRQLTFLNLRQPAEVVLLEVSPPASNAPQVAASTTTTEESFTFPPAEFDEAGLTALERVLRAPQPSTPAQ